PRGRTSLVLDGVLGDTAEEEADRLLPLFRKMREQPGRAREDRDRLHGVVREPEVAHHRGNCHRDVPGQGLVPRLRDGTAQRTRTRDVVSADAALVGELEDALRTRVDRSVHRMAESGDLAAGVVNRTRELEWLLVRLEQPRTLPGRAEDHRPGA